MVDIAVDPVTIVTMAVSIAGAIFYYSRDKQKIFDRLKAQDVLVEKLAEELTAKIADIRKCLEELNSKPVPNLHEEISRLTRLVNRLSDVTRKTAV